MQERHQLRRSQKRTTTGLSALFVAGLMALAAVPAHAQNSDLVTHPWPEMVLRGGEPSASHVVQLPPQAERTSSPVVELTLSVSELVDRERSTLVLSVDGKPEASWTLARLVGSGDPRYVTLRATLPDIPKGFHRIGLAGRFKDHDDQHCEPPETVWMRIRSGTISWRQRPRNVHSRLTLPLASFPKIWARSRAVRLGWPESQPGFTGAALSADHLLRRLGLRPVWPGAPLPPLGTPARHDVPELVIGTVTAPPPSGTERLPMDWRKQLAEGPPEAVMMHLSARRLVLVGATTASLEGAMRGLADGKFRELCGEDVCVTGTFDPRRTMDDHAGAEEPSLHVRFADLGIARPLLARGYGRHEARVVLRPPSTWDLRGWPKMHIHMRVGAESSTQTKTAQESRVEVLLDGRPIASFDLQANPSDPKGGVTTDVEPGSRLRVLEVKLPRWAKKLPSWEVTLVTHWVPANRRRCSGRPDEGPWASFEPESAFLLPRVEFAKTGLAGFAASLEREHPPALVVGPGIPTRALAWTAPLLYGLTQHLPGTVATVATSCPIDRPCIHLAGANTAPPPAPLTRYGTGASSMWFDATGTLGIPRLSVAETLVARVSPKTLVVPGRLDLYVPKGAPAKLIPTPGVDELSSPWAVAARGRWFMLEPVGTRTDNAGAKAEEPVAVVAPEPRQRRRTGLMVKTGAADLDNLTAEGEDLIEASKEDRLARLIDIAWVGGGLLLLVLLWRILRPRRRPMMDPSQVEAH